MRKPRTTQREAFPTITISGCTFTATAAAPDSSVEALARALEQNAISIGKVAEVLKTRGASGPLLNLSNIGRGE